MTKEPEITEGQLSEDAMEVQRSFLETVAATLGPESASARALRRADAHGGPVRYWYSPAEGTVTLELVRADA